MKPYLYPLRVYYEDTDAGGVVYYANYLKFAERARTEMLREAGFGQAELREKFGVLFVVRRVEADYLIPARLDDMLCVETVLHERSQTAMSMHQVILRGETVLARLLVRIVCINEGFKPVRIPESVIHSIERTPS